MPSKVYDLSLNTTTVTKDWIFSDLQVDLQTEVPKVVRSICEINSDKDLDAIQNGIKNMFLFDRGERILEPEFGNSLYKYLYEPISDLVSRMIGEEIKYMFKRWEPRVVIRSIIVTPFYDENQYYIEVIYEVPVLNTGALSFEYSVNARR